MPLSGARFAELFVPFDGPHSSTAVWPSGVPFPVEIDENGEARFQTQERGPWGMLSKITALAVSREFGEAGRPRTPAQSGIIVYGVRSMCDPRQSGHEVEGHVSIGGVKRSAFTSSQMFLVDGRLVGVAVLHVRMRPSPRQRRALTCLSTVPHARCPRAGHCVEHEQHSWVAPCR